MNLIARVLVSAFVCVAPSLLFLGLWHGLQRMQDGEFITRVAGQHGATVEDLLPTTRRTHNLDSTEQRRLQRMAPEGGSTPQFDDTHAPDEGHPGR
jgi:type II secretory pathway component PulL